VLDIAVTGPDNVCGSSGVPGLDRGIVTVLRSTGFSTRAQLWRNEYSVASGAAAGRSAAIPIAS